MLRNLSPWVETQSLAKGNKTYWNVLSKRLWASGALSGGWIKGLPEFLSRIPCQSNYLCLCLTKRLYSDKCKNFLSNTIFTAKRKIMKLICLANKFYFCINISLLVTSVACYIKIKLHLWTFSYRVTSDKFSMIWTLKPSYKNWAQRIIVVIICKVLVYLILWLSKLRCIRNPTLKFMFCWNRFLLKSDVLPCLFVCLFWLISSPANW